MPLTLHIVPHTHWDREWYRPFQDFRLRLVRLLDRLLDLLGSDGSYQHFMLDGQTIILDDYLEIRPGRVDEIRRLVRMGRLAIGPWYVLPDEFLVSPESLVRNLLLGDQACRRFGGKMAVGYVPDPFGHIGQLPQILRGFGIHTAAFRRGLAEEPVELRWESPDGSRVLVCYLRDGYDNAARLPTDPEAFVAAIRAARDSLAPHARSDHLLLLAGTDHQEAQPELPALIAYANAGRLDGDRLAHSSLTAYVEAIETRFSQKTGLLETVRGELRSPQRHHLLPGVLSARMWIKQRNAAVETLLTRWAEPCAAWAELLDAPSDSHTHLTGHEPPGHVGEPRAFLRHAWRLLLQNHPHDSICGCSVDQVHREMAPRFDQAEQIAGAIAAQGLHAIAEQVDTASPLSLSQGAGHPIIVFNPVGGPRTDVVTARLGLPIGGPVGLPDAVEVVDLAGQVVPHQLSGDGALPSAGRLWREPPALRAGASGSAERQLFRIEIAAHELKNYLGFVQGGRVLNHVIQRVDVRCEDDCGYIGLAVSEDGQPDPAHLATARAQIEELIATGTITRFIVRSVVTEPRDLVWVAPDLPAHGYTTFIVRPAHPDTRIKHRDAVTAPLLETDLLTVRITPADGTLTLTDKRSGAVYSGLNRFVDVGDRGDEYNYCRPEEDEMVSEPFAPPSVAWVENGPARQTLQISQVYRLPRSLRPDPLALAGHLPSRRVAELGGATKLGGAGSARGRGRSRELVGLPIVSRVSVYPAKAVPRVDIETTVDNQAQDHRLRVHFPTPLRVDYAHTEAHYHVARRSIPQAPPGPDTAGWVEQPVPTAPQCGWADVSDGQVGLMVANRGLPEVEFIPTENGTAIALTLLRCVGWLSRDDLHCRQGHAGPALPTPEAQCNGRHTFHYALIPHTGDWTQARAQADAFRAPLRAVATGIHAGPLPPVAGLVHIEPAAFVLTAIKQPEENTGLIVRGVNLSDQPATVRLRPWRPLSQPARVNLKEDLIEPLLADADGAVSFTARPWEIVTVRWRGW